MSNSNIDHYTQMRDEMVVRESAQDSDDIDDEDQDEDDSDEDEEDEKDSSTLSKTAMMGRGMMK